VPATSASISPSASAVLAQRAIEMHHMLGRFIVWLFWALVITWVSRRIMAAMRQTAPSSGFHESPPPPPPRTAEPSPYDVLGVRREASATEIRTAYQSLVKQYHPDRVASMPAEFQEVADRKTKEINAAYSSLKRAGRLEGS
jgi:DnaJ-domain-containing protein 1